MVNLLHVGIEDFNECIKDKELYYFGAGGRVSNVLNFIRKPKAIIDNYKVKSDSNIENINIINFEDFCRIIAKKDNHQIAILIIPAGYAYDIYNQLNDNEECAGITCCILNELIDMYKEQVFEFVKGKINIPKKIHYCWFGNSKKSEIIEKCIESWYKFCPDYEIICWSEENYDINKNDYMREAYESKKWGFVPDYARLDIIYNCGGVYLDTDVELLKSLDDLLYDSMFCVALNEMNIAFGAGFGAKKNCHLIKELRDYYDDKHFINKDGTMNLTACTVYQNAVLRSKGILTYNKYQRLEDITVYPAGVFISKDYTKYQTVKSYTIGVHHGSGSWYTDKMRRNINIIKNKNMYKGEDGL